MSIFAKIKSCKNRYNISDMILLSLLIILDFILTYTGINTYGVIEEANIFLIWLFDLPFAAGLTVRVFMTAVIMIPFCLLYKLNYSIYKKTLTAAYVINLIVMVLHARWIIFLLYSK